MQTPTSKTRDTPLTILVIIGLVLAVILTIKTMPVSIHYTIEYYKYIMCAKEAFYTGEFKTYTTCSINALKIIWNALEAWPRMIIQGW